MTYRYEDFASKHFSATDISGAEMMTQCPVHQGSGSNMQFNMEMGLWVCFKCGAGGGMKALCRALGVPFDGEPIPDIDDVRRKLQALQIPTKDKGQPDPIPESTLRRYSFPTDYWRSRGFKDQTIEMFDLGLDIMADAVTIPVRNENRELLGVVKRYLDPDVELRYRYPKGFKRSKNLFASWLIDEVESDELVLTEGGVDAMMCWQDQTPANALYGSSLSRAQVRLLRRMGVTTIVTFMDNDIAGRKAADSCIGIKHHIRKGKKTQEYVPELDLRNWFIVKKVQYTGKMPSDPGAMKKKGMIRKAVASARRL